MIIYNSKLFKLPFMQNYVGITLTSDFVLFMGSKEEVSKKLADHEKGHEVQIALLDSAAFKGPWDGVLTFWLSYLFIYLYLLVKYRDHWKAYSGIIWERLARGFSNANN